MPKKIVSPTVSVRVTPALYRAFKVKSSKYGGVSEVLRELMLALTEDRLTIRPPSTQGTLYANS